MYTRSSVVMAISYGFSIFTSSTKNKEIWLLVLLILVVCARKCGLTVLLCLVLLSASLLDSRYQFAAMPLVTSHSSLIIGLLPLHAFSLYSQFTLAIKVSWASASLEGNLFFLHQSL